MGSVTIREHNDIARDRSGQPTMLVKGEIIRKQTVTTVEGSSVDSAAMSAQTHFVALEADSDVRYRMRPRNKKFIALAAELNDTPLPAGAVVIEPVYPGCIIAFLQTSELGGAETPYQQSYVPVLAL
jgi:hypothetical protein